MKSSLMTLGAGGVAAPGRARDAVIWHLVHEPCGWWRTLLRVEIRLHQCTGCSRRVWRQSADQAAAPRAPVPRHTAMGVDRDRVPALD